MRHSRRDGDREQGQIMILFALSLVVILVFASIVVDLGMLRNNRQILVNTMDAAALAGGTKLPVNGATEGTAANALIDYIIQKNYPGLPTSAYKIAYRCLIGVASGVADIAEIPGTCDPTHALGHTPTTADFVGTGSDRFSTCSPSLGDMCNVVVITGSATTPYGLGGVVGITSGSTGAVQSAACNGPCGPAQSTPVDVVLVMDRSGSMSGTDTTNSLTAANSIRTLYKPGVQWLGLGLLGPSQPSGSCLVHPDGSLRNATAPADVRRWVPITLSGTGAPLNQDYTQSTSTLATSLKTPCYENSGTGTDLADPIAMAEYELLHSTRAGPAVRRGIILETDGQPNTETISGTYTSSNDCLNAWQAADHAKKAGIEIFTIGFGLDGSVPPCPDGSGAWHGKTAAALLASMASPSTSGVPAVNGGCPGTSNTDGDHYFCIPKSAGATTDLSEVFKAAAAQLAKGGLHLVQSALTPTVTSVSPNSGKCHLANSVTITGQFFTDATAVSFGTQPATSFTVNSDTKITATSVAGTPKSATPVDITVTTFGGTSPTVSADQYTYTSSLTSPLAPCG